MSIVRAKGNVLMLFHCIRISVNKLRFIYRIGKPIEIDEISLGSDEKALKLNSGDGCTT